MSFSPSDLSRVYLPFLPLPLFRDKGEASLPPPHYFLIFDILRLLTVDILGVLGGVLCKFQDRGETEIAKMIFVPHFLLLSSFFGN